MALNSGLFQDQDQTEHDLTEGPGWTIDQQQPSFWDNSLAAPARGLGQAAADGISLLAHGLPAIGQALPFINNPLSVLTHPQAAKDLVTDPTKPEAGGVLDQAEQKARDYAKTLNPDPRVTGNGANLVQGFTKAVGEFTAGAALGGPGIGATLLGSAEGYAHYHDLLDQGVDPDTAKKSAMLTALTSGGGALLPMGLPAKFLAGLSTPATYLAQAAAGAAINTGFGLGSRYASAKILDDAGYHEMAEQQKPWDALNVATDALSGLFFGAHAAWHGLNHADVDPAIRDAAKAVQDRQEVNERAPGVPVDMASSAIHRQSLETALGDLLNDKPVELKGDDIDGATFARPEENSEEVRQIMHDEFVKSGVLDTAGQFDRWLAGEEEPKPVEKPTAQEPEGEPVEAPKGEVPPQFKEGFEEQEPGEQAAQTGAVRAISDRPNLQIADENGEGQSAADKLERAKEEESQVNKEAEPMHAAAVDCEERHA